MSSASESSNSAVSSVNVSVARDLMNSDHRYLDVRTEEEFNKGHPEGAVNVPYIFFTPEGKRKNPEFMAKVSQIFAKEEAFVVGCAAGARSIVATGDLVAAGFKNAKNVEGGFAAWSQKGFAVKKPVSGL